MNRMAAEEYKSWFNLGQNKAVRVGEFFEFIIRFLYVSVLRPGDIAFDGGANGGRHTFPMADLVGTTGHVIGFEGIPELASSLLKKIALSQLNHISIVNQAIGSEIGQTSFTIVRDLPAFSGRKRREGIPEAAQNSVQEVTVQMTTMDATLARFGHDNLRFIKLDLEGGEYDALRGSSSIMANQHPMIVFENGRISSAKIYGYTMDDWFAIFEQTGYRVYDIFGRPFTRNQWGAGDIPWYFIAVKRREDIEFVNNTLPFLVRSISEIAVRIAGESAFHSAQKTN